MKPLNQLIYCLFLLVYCFTLHAGELINIDPEQLQTMQKNDNALVIDVRTVKEWQQTGVIPDSEQLEFFNESGQYDSAAWLKKFNALRQSDDQPVILVCHSGNRSGKVGTFLTKQLGMDQIYNLQNGISGWLKQGKATEADCTVKSDCDASKP